MSGTGVSDLHVEFATLQISCISRDLSSALTDRLKPKLLTLVGLSRHVTEPGCSTNGPSASSTPPVSNSNRFPRMQAGRRNSFRLRRHHISSYLHPQRVRVVVETQHAKRNGHNCGHFSAKLASRFDHQAVVTQSSVSDACRFLILSRSILSLRALLSPFGGALTESTSRYAPCASAVAAPDYPACVADYRAKSQSISTPRNGCWAVRRRRVGAPDDVRCESSRWKCAT